MGEKTLFNHLPDDDDTSGKGHVLVVEIPSVGEGVGVGGQKTLVGTGHGQARRCFQSFVNGLSLEIETLQANLTRFSLHQLIIF